MSLDFRKSGGQPHTYAANSNRNASVAVPVIVAFSIMVVNVWIVIELLWRGAVVTGTRPMQLMAAALCCAVSVRLIVIVLQVEFDFPRAAFYIFTLVWMCYAPLAQLALQAVPIEIPFSPEIYQSGLVIVLIGIGGYEAGVFLQGRKEKKRSDATTCSEEWRINMRSLRIVTVIGLIVVAALLSTVGGPRILISSRSEFSDAVFGIGSSSSSKASGAIINSVIIVVPFVAAMGWLICLTSCRKMATHSRLLGILAIAANFLVNNPVAQSRFWVATVYLSLLGCWLTPRFRQFPKLAVALSLVFLIVLFPFSDIFRHAEGSRAISIGDPLSQLAIKGDFDAFPQLTSAVRHVDAYGPKHGGQAIGAAGFFVPRMFWAQKAEDTGTMLGKEAHLGNVNLSAPLWAEGLVDFNLVGVFCYLFLLGRLSLVMGRLTKIATLGPGFACFVGVYQFVLLRGSLLQAMGISFALAILFRAVMTKKVKEEI
jgi:hypothetical protein